jgi:hypothetical protein
MILSVSFLSSEKGNMVFEKKSLFFARFIQQGSSQVQFLLAYIYSQPNFVVEGRRIALIAACCISNL